ncbi:DUF418 domain-containing protein [Brachybacterium sacelli]|uniref:Membrane protein YeiB n=1 Tax=Brachybacterium sacelli TaxID=173364 RepID=A0ABS4WYU6_9MICO|nr:DUF418 domain-containing protein [Brachybacterium sacelli]MBP2381381.1 putative membrane protein YeiB [Brachybacterium sacelli]
MTDSTSSTLPTASPSASPADSAPRPQRLLVLDVVRGAALCGILFANVGTILGVSVPWTDGRPPLSSTLQQLLVQQRFFPIFSLLFGVGFGMLWSSAVRRATHPRVVLLRRLLALGVLGFLHQILQPGEALLPYATVGIVVLLPLTWVPARPRALVAGLGGAVLTVAAAPLGGVSLIPGLFLLGFAAAVADLPRRVEESARPAVVLALAAALLAAPFIVLQLRSPESAGFDAVSSIAGLSSGLCLVGILGALLHTPARRVLGAFFVPLGRMALTNYVGASVLGVLFALPWLAPLGQEYVEITDAQMVALWGGCVLLLIVQSLASRAWLARIGQGPLEALWRRVTWGRAR